MLYLLLLNFYKFTHNLVPVSDSTLLPPGATESTRLGATGGFRFSAGAGPVLCSAVSEFNGLPHQIRALNSLSVFKKELKLKLLDATLSS